MEELDWESPLHLKPWASNQSSESWRLISKYILSIAFERVYCILNDLTRLDKEVFEFLLRVFYASIRGRITHARLISMYEEIKSAFIKSGVMIEEGLPESGHLAGSYLSTGGNVVGASILYLRPDKLFYLGAQFNKQAASVSGCWTNRGDSIFLYGWGEYWSFNEERVRKLYFYKNVNFETCKLVVVDDKTVENWQDSLITNTKEYLFIGVDTIVCSPRYYLPTTLEQIDQAIKNNFSIENLPKILSVPAVKLTEYLQRSECDIDQYSRENLIQLLLALVLGKKICLAELFDGLRPDHLLVFKFVLSSWFSEELSSLDLLIVLCIIGTRVN